MKKTPLKRTSSLRRTTRIKNAKPAVRRAQAKQKQALIERAGPWIGTLKARCEFLELHDGRWERCVWPGIHAAHIIPRRECGKARDSVDVVLLSCSVHHFEYDSPLTPEDKRPRVPKDLLALARAAITAANQKAPLKQSIKEKLNG